MTHTRCRTTLCTIALLPLGLVAACFGEPPSLPDDGEDTTGASTDPTDADSGTAPTSDPPTGSMSSTNPGTSVGTSASTTSDASDTSATTIEPDTEAPACGAMGEACCEGSMCDEGACLLGHCVAFAGVFMDGELCPDCPSVLQALECGCPPGFELGPALPLLSSGCIKDTAKPWTDESVYVCQASTYVPGRSDWGGTYLRADGEGCVDAPSCVVGNPYTNGQCDCPPESTAVEALVYGHCGGEPPDPPPAYRLGICVGDAEPLTIGGVVYSEGPVCLVPHPETGSCECPEDFTRQALRVISQATPTNMAGDFGFCVRAP